MSEGVRKNGPVGRIQANDSDIGPNAVLTYSLAQGDRTFFQMVTIPPDKDSGGLNQGELRIFAVSRKAFINKILLLLEIDNK